MASLDYSFRAPTPEETKIWEGENESVRPRIHLFCSLCSLLPPLFDKHSECYGNGLIDVADKPCFGAFSKFSLTFDFFLVLVKICM